LKDWLKKIESCLISHNRDRQDNLITADEFSADAHSQEETLNIFTIIEKTHDHVYQNNMTV